MQFDTSNYPKDHPSGIESKLATTRRLLVCLRMSRWEIIKELVGLRAKLYSYKVFEGNEEKKYKGVKKPFVKRSNKFDIPTPTP